MTFSLNTGVSRRTKRCGAALSMTLLSALVPAASADAAVRVAFASPQPSTQLAANQSTPMAVDVTDGSSVRSVDFYADDRKVCTDLTAPYSCGFQPQAEDIGSTTLVAVASTNSGDTVTAVRTVRVLAVNAQSVSQKTTSTKAKGGWTVATTGKLALPSGAAFNLCAVGGAVNVKYQFGRKAVLQTVPVRSDCTFTTKPARVARTSLSSSRRLRARAQFLGSRGINPTRVITGSIRLK
jgi:hypothetical protein